MQTPYGVEEVKPQWILEWESLGSKEKFWYHNPTDQARWLFKFPQADTGQDWAEKIAAEIAASMDVQHAIVELALYQEKRGSTTKSFAQPGTELWHGNSILAGLVTGYDPHRKFEQSDHALPNIWHALERIFVVPEAVIDAKIRFAGYLVLDAVVGNTDRHHENWGVLRERRGDSWYGFLAPSFDHASSLGRELLDQRRERLMAERRIGWYVERGRGAVYLPSEARPPSPLALVRWGATHQPAVFMPALDAIRSLSDSRRASIIARIPEGWMMEIGRQFAGLLIQYNLAQLRGLLA